MAKVKFLPGILLIIVGVSSFGQANLAAQSPASLFSLTLAPSFNIPIGRDVGIYGNGFGGDLSATYRMSFLPLLFAGGSIGYSSMPLANATTTLSLFCGGLNAGVHIDLLDRLSVRVSGAAGYFYALLNDTTGNGGGNPFVSGNASITYGIFPFLNAGLGISYRYFFGLYNDLSVSLGASYNFPVSGGQPTQPTQQAPVKPSPLTGGTTQQPQKGTGLEITKFEPISIFPVFYKFYNDHPVGKAVLHNWEKTAATDIKVSFLVKQYMDNPQLCQAPQSLEPGEDKEIQLSGLFKNNILEITEPTLVSANITIKYTQAGKAQEREITQAVRIYDRNAMIWEDDRRAAAFITSKDPTVLKFSKNITAMLKGRASDAVNPKLLAALGMHEALCEYGVSYVVDPARSFDKAYQKKNDVDFLQFPQQTLEYKAGDCDDLSILYCALLESIGVETALITIPGHIYMAFSLEMKPDDARKAFQRPDDLIFNQDKTWIPIEITERKGGFMKAWQEGAKEWRENKSKSQASFNPVHDCWAVYESVGFSGSVVAINMPQEDKVVKTYSDGVTRFIDLEIYAKVATIQAEIKKSQDSTKAINKLGVLYAQYGLYDRAQKEFAKIVDKEYVPALINMGNIFFKRNDAKGALGFYERAQKKAPDNSTALLCVARANHELENYGQAKEAYTALKAVNPDLAEQFAYLEMRGEEGARAAELSQVRGVVLWEEEK